MHLKSLTLKGFKSFAEATTLDLEPGVTVVVGPNGAGKSNVVDAVAWVLGAQGPRTVRSSRMEDVIFAGSSRRPALGRAEVALTIDNSSGRLPIEVAEVTVTRTLFRSGDSEYALNGAPCRLLDVQELLSDTGVGRQQHVIVGQGQLDVVLSARPEDRRLLIEEAAGVLKYRRRRERTERRIEATEADLVRLGDLLGEVRRQLRPLRHQAEAARRHDGLAAELVAVRRHLAGRRLAQLAARESEAGRAQASLLDEEAALGGALGRLDLEVAAAEAATSAQGQAGSAEVLRCLEGLRERARGLAAVLAERRRSTRAALEAAEGDGVVASLEAEAARLVGELAAADAEAEELVPRAQQLAAAQAELDRERASQAPGRLGPPGATASQGGRLEGTAEVADAQARIGSLRHGLERDRAEVGRLEERLANLADRGARLVDEGSGWARRLHDMDQAGPAMRAEIDEASRRRRAAAAALAEAESARREAEKLHWSLTARAEALAMALSEARARAGEGHLAGLGGLLGPLVELIEVDDGWEEAFAAAAGDALEALVVGGPVQATEALERLASAGRAGAVLPGVTTEEGAGLSEMATLEVVGATPLRPHVRSAVPGVDRLLDLVLAGTVAVAGDWRVALRVAGAQRALVVVTMTGDRFSPSGWRVGSDSGGVTRAAAEEAGRGAREATQALQVATEAVEVARAEDGAAARSEAELSRALDHHRAQREAAAGALTRLEAERQDTSAEVAVIQAQRRDLVARAGADEDQVKELEALLPAMQAAALAAAEQAAQAQARLDTHAGAAAVLRSDLEVRAASLEERRRVLTQRLDQVECRLQRHASERDQVAARRRALEAWSVAVERLTRLVADRLVHLDHAVGAAQERHRLQAQQVQAGLARLDRLRSDRVATERQRSVVRERQQRAGIELAEARLRREAAVEALRQELGCEPEAVLGWPCPTLAEGVTPAQRERELEREVRLLGPVNSLAAEELAALEERHGFLEGQLEDVRSARRELAKVTRAIDAEIVGVFEAAYQDVAKSFEALFATLFPGGTGRLALTDPDNLLDAGVEVEACPAGKRVRRLSLLSGGERSLVALAFLFAVFRSRPSPFYLLDEVEAALDDVNLHRFLGLVQEFRHEAQLVIVTHQKRTMEVADCLYGVTMAPGGSSRVLSERVGSPA